MIRKSDVDTCLKRYQGEELAEKLSDIMVDEYDEYALLKLADTYAAIGDEKSASKTLRKIQRLFPDGLYAEQVNEKLQSQTIKAKSDLQPQPKAAGMVKDNEKSTAGPEVSDTLKTQKTEKVNSNTLGGTNIQVPTTIKAFFTNVVGMDQVAKSLTSFYNTLYLQNERSKNNFQRKILKSTNFFIVGARGSGKTTVGKIIAQILHTFGIRPEPEPVLIQARRVLEAYEARDGGEASVIRLFDHAQGKTVIVENLQDILKEREEYLPVRQLSLCLEKIMKEKEDTLSIVLTGDRESMSTFFSSDETLQDAFYTVIEIPPYSLDDLISIADKLAEPRGLMIDPEAKKVLRHKLQLEYKSPYFMNAISIERLLDDATIKMADRYVSSGETSEKAMVLLHPEDFSTDVEEDTLKGLLAELESLTGLKSVKGQIQKRVDSIVIKNRAREAGVERNVDDGTLHMLFLGSPGTGKTTVARLLGRIYKCLGILPNGDRTVECSRSDLVAKYVGHTAGLVKQKVKEALGGVLFIDEAYSICQGDNDSFGEEAVDQLIQEMENNRGNLMVILAGYTQEMETFMSTNPGFQSRIRNRIVFDDYTVSEMVEIFKGLLKSQKLNIEEGIEDLIYILLDTCSKEPNFGNARGVRNVVENVIEVQNKRLMALVSSGSDIVADEYSLIRREDIEPLLHGGAEKKTINQLLEELNALTGLNSVKRQVNELVLNLKVEDFSKSKGWTEKSGHGSLHLVFKGNAGTGKTTVARLIGQIYKELGVLQKNVFIEVGRKDLVGAYQGQTAIKTGKKIDEAMGGILFIDEAYNLVNGENDDFGKEAIGTLLGAMESSRENFMVIIAGYPEEMDKFLETNQGLASRFANEIVFEDYTDEELYEIFTYTLKKMDLTLETASEDMARDLIIACRHTQKDFGNARGVRNIAEALSKKKNARIAENLNKGIEPSHDDIRTITGEDIDTYREELRGA